MALTYLKKYEEDINSVNIEQKDLNRFLLYYIVHYIDSKYNNTMLQYYIKKDFIGWIKETQAFVNKFII